MNIIQMTRVGLTSIDIFERGLNITGYFPVLGSITAIARTLLAKAELVCGFVGIIFSVGLLINGAPTGLALNISLGLLGHSMLNGMRSVLEYIPFVPLATCLPYDVISYVLLGRRLFPITHLLS